MSERESLDLVEIAIRLPEDSAFRCEVTRLPGGQYKVILEDRTLTFDHLPNTKEVFEAYGKTDTKWYPSLFRLLARMAIATNANVPT